MLDLPSPCSLTRSDGIGISGARLIKCRTSQTRSQRPSAHRPVLRQRPSRLTTSPDAAHLPGTRSLTCWNRLVWVPQHLEHSRLLRVLTVVSAEWSYSAPPRRIVPRWTLALLRKDLRGTFPSPETFYSASRRGLVVALDALVAPGYRQPAQGEVDPGSRHGSPTSQWRTVKSVRRQVAGSRRLGRLTPPPFLIAPTKWLKFQLSVPSMDPTRTTGTFFSSIHAWISSVGMGSATVSSCKYFGHARSFLRERKSPLPDRSFAKARTDCEPLWVLELARGRVRRSNRACQSTRAPPNGSAALTARLRHHSKAYRLVLVRQAPAGLRSDREPGPLPEPACTAKWAPPTTGHSLCIVFRGQGNWWAILAVLIEELLSMLRRL
jgi:hypothetical protein